MERVVELFAKDFERWEITLPARDVAARQSGRIEHDEWTIQYDFGRDAHGEFLDYYAAHRVPNYKGAAADRHVRLYDSGLRVQLPPILEAYVHGREPTREEIERARQRFAAGETGPAEPVRERAATAPAPKPAAPTADDPPPRSSPSSTPRPERERSTGRAEHGGFRLSSNGLTPGVRWALIAAGVLLLVGGGVVLASSVRRHRAAVSPDGVASAAEPTGDSLPSGAALPDSPVVRRAPLPPRDLTGPGYLNATRPADLPSSVRPGSAMPLIPSGGRRPRSEPTVFRRKGVVR